MYRYKRKTKRNTCTYMNLYILIYLYSDRYPRGFTHAGGQLFNDLRLTVFDSFERMSGYTYFGIIDFDEFLIPTRNRTLKEMLVS